MPQFPYKGGALVACLILIGVACAPPPETPETPETPGTLAPNIERSVAELKEGTVRTVYIDRPKVGAKGYVGGDWRNGEVRVEVWGFPQNEKGYEVFLFEIDVYAYMDKMFIDGDAQLANARRSEAARPVAPHQLDHRAVA